MSFVDGRVIRQRMDARDQRMARELKQRVAARQMWIVYDERAMDGTTDDYAVLESCRSEREAMRCDFEGVVYRYDVADGNQLVNETMIGPTRLLARRIA